MSQIKQNTSMIQSEGSESEWLKLSNHEQGQY